MFNNFEKWAWVLVFILAIILVAVGLLRRSGPLSVPVRGQWQNDPVVVVCNDSPFSIEQVEEVVQRWENRGHTFSAIIMEWDTCPNQIDGFILVKSAGANFPADKSGIARTSIDSETGEIYSSTIEIFRIELIILEHEIGHALGYDHVSRRGHLMFPDFEGLGRDDEGLFIE